MGSKYFHALEISVRTTIRADVRYDYEPQERMTDDCPGSEEYLYITEIINKDTGEDILDKIPEEEVEALADGMLKDMHESAMEDKWERKRAREEDYDAM